MTRVLSKIRRVPIEYIGTSIHKIPLTLAWCWLYEALLHMLFYNFGFPAWFFLTYSITASTPACATFVS